MALKMRRSQLKFRNGYGLPFIRASPRDRERTVDAVHPFRFRIASEINTETYAQTRSDPMRNPLLAIGAVVITSSAAIADVYIPEGELGTVLHLNEVFEVVGRIEGLDNVHGLAGATNRGILVAGSLTETEVGMVPKPSEVSEEDHAAHHGGGEDAGPAASSLVTLVDADSHEILRRIEVPGIVHHVGISSDERFAAVTHPGLDAVSLIDLESGEVTATVTTGPIPEYAIADPKTGNFFVSNAGNNTISELDPEDGIVKRNFKLQGPPKHMLLDAEARQLIVSESDTGKVSIVDADSGETLSSFEISGELHGVSADKDAIWSSARERDRVVRIDRATGERLEVNVGPEPYHMARVDDALLVSSAAKNELWVLDPETLDLIKTLETDSTGHQFARMP
ncbi:YncE family protein [Roseovarius indicus]|uniref:YncE family protein n=1 Tax=Roseovarius indicus TaxID=540747 RepID=UPI001C309082|nr:YncE family protein [Roseovarius indicus]